ncbi:MAG: ABC transporter ATP-binding protein [Caldilineaceae bacterium]|nr:ABC transporter ATP-binding protein [Caldilineaceae bacterium]
MSVAQLSNAQLESIDLKETATESRLVGLWRLMAGYRLTYLVAALSLGLATIARTSTLLLLRYFVDSYLDQDVRTVALWTIAVGFVVLALIQGGFTFLSGTLAAKTAEGIVLRLRNYLLDHIQRLPFAYHDEAQTGELIQRVTSDVDAIRRFFAAEAISTSRILFLFLVNFGALLLINWQLALISVIIIPVITAMSIFFFQRVSKAYEEYQQQEAELSNALQENLTGVRVVKAFARQEFEEGKFDEENQKKYQRGKRLLLMHSVYWPISDVLSGIQMLVGFTVGALMAINGTITVGTYMAYAGMLLLIIWPIRNLGRLVVDMSRGLVSFGRVTTVIRETREVLDDDSFVPPKHLRGEISFEHVSFDYAAQDSAGQSQAEPSNAGSNGRQSNGAEAQGKPDLTTAVLHDVSFHCQPGQRIAVMGSTGAGKTSLVNLLPRFYDYTDGRILLDGRELTDYPRHYMRSQVGIVEQEPFLFSRTVRDNITYGVGRDVPQSEVEEAARAAAIHDVILTKLPDGYDTLVGERGTTLSGGQKQRVAIARTLLKNPRILILDDSTSAVDTETEALIRRALEELMENRTTFIIAHRIQTVMSADLILVLDKGRIVQSGVHDELMEQDGLYRRIYAAQTRIESELQKELSRVN